MLRYFAQICLLQIIASFPLIYYVQSGGKKKLVYSNFWTFILQNIEISLKTLVFLYVYQRSTCMKSLHANILILSANIKKLSANFLTC